MIAGLDLSTKRIGYAGPDGATWSISAHAGAEDPSRRLHELARALERLLRVFPPRPELVIVEGYSLASPGRLSLVRLGELGGVVRLRLFELGIPYVEIPPTSLKRYATGNGSAKKPAMQAAAAELGGVALNDDEADAFLLRHLGRAAYGLEPLPPDHRLEVVSSITWPGGREPLLRRPRRSRDDPVENFLALLASTSDRAGPGRSTVSRSRSTRACSSPSSSTPTGSRGSPRD